MEPREMREGSQGRFTDRYQNVWEWSPICPICGNGQASTLYQAQSSSYPFRTDVSPTIVRCRCCQLAWVTPRVAHVLSPKWEYPDPSPDGLTTRKHCHTLEHIERYKQPGKLLDLGCGHGLLLREARGRGWQVMGIEPNESKARYAANDLGLPVFHGYLDQADLMEGSFDVVVMQDVIEHLRDPLAVLRQAHRILKDEGVLFVRTPDIESWEARLMRDRWSMLYVATHRYLYSPDSLGRLLSMAEFITCDRQLWTSGPSKVRNLAKYVLSRAGIAISHLQVIALKRRTRV